MECSVTVRFTSETPQKLKGKAIIVEGKAQYDKFEEEIVVPQPKPVQRNTKKVVVEQDLEKDRVKYTSTMDKNLRRDIKIICAQRGLLFASFIEDACREKLRREGVL